MSLVATVVFVGRILALAHLSMAALAPYETNSRATTIINATRADDRIVAEPSVTSIHQVWTSSSSNSMDELSPEMISKLRQGLPFLAAYAMRPRLVGMSALDSSPLVSSPVLGGSTVNFIDKTIIEPSASSQVDRSSSFLPHHRSSSNPAIGDYDELKVETSSTSRSEHRHNRRTSLKRKPSKLPQAKSSSATVAAKRKPSKNKRIIIKASNKIARNRSMVNGKRQQTKRRLSAVQHSSSLHNGAKKRRTLTALKQQGKLQQQQLKGDEAQSTEARDTTKGGDSGGVKGASGGRTPFYASRGKKTDAGAGTTLSNDEYDDKRGGGAADGGLGNDEEERTAVKSWGRDKNGEGAEPAGNEVDGDEGDYDVNEDEDTVTIMPKFDGVDDNPDPEADSEDRIDDFEGADGANEDADASRESGGASDDGMAGGGGGGTGLASGGGVGGSAAAGGGAKGNRGRSEKDAADGATVPGVEFVNDDGGSSGSEDASDSSSMDANRSSGEGGSGSGGAARDDGRDGGRRFPEDDNVNDVDYEDDGDRSMDGIHSRSKGDSKGAAGADDGNAAGDNTNLSDNGQMPESRRDSGSASGDAGSNTKSSHSSGTSDNCDYANDHGHDHHDTIKWLQDAIPGEPHTDYPILSKTNGTNFNCQDQKHPGYYADVKSRCQVFHVCQTDGRQSSFLCPNGTIFSQITTSCVWWDSFNCEDAPQHYGKNSLLYSDNNANDGFKGKFMPVGTRINDADDSSQEGKTNSLDDFINSMKRGMTTESEDDSNQRKTTSNIDGIEDPIESDAEPSLGARLHQGRRRAAPRRHRHQTTDKQLPRLKHRKALRLSSKPKKRSSSIGELLKKKLA